MENSQQVSDMIASFSKKRDELKAWLDAHDALTPGYGAKYADYLHYKNEVTTLELRENFS